MIFNVYKSIVTNGSKVIIDGVVVSDTDEYKQAKSITININSNIGNIDVSICDKVIVNGNVEGYVKTSQGDIEITGNVDGDVKTSQGNVKCGNVTGNVKASMGNIKHTKCDCNDSNETKINMPII